MVDGQVGLVTAVVALAEFDRLEPDLCDPVKDEVLAAYVEIGEGNDPRAVRQLRPEMTARFGADRQLERNLDRVRERRHLSGPVEYDQLTHYALALDPENAARLEAALDLLSAPARPPAPSPTCAVPGNAGPTHWSRSSPEQSPPAAPCMLSPRRSWS